MAGIDTWAMAVDNTTAAGATAAADAAAAGVPPAGGVSATGQQEMLEGPPGMDPPRSAPIPSIEQLMSMLVAQGNQVQALVQAMSLKKKCPVNSKLDERNFRRPKEFTNKRDEWKEWEMRFISAVRECDVSFAECLWTSEKQGDEVDEMILGRAYIQLSATLYARLIGLTTKSKYLKPISL